MGRDILSILSNPIRLRIIRCLSEGEKNVEGLVGTCEIAQSAVSQHLAKLKQIGILGTERRGKYIFYKLLYPEAAEIALRVEQLKEKLKNENLVSQKIQI